MIEEKTIIVPLTKSVDSVEAHAVDCSTCINVKDANQIPSQQEQDRAKSIVAAPLWDKGLFTFVIYADLSVDIAYDTVVRILTNYKLNVKVHDVKRVQNRVIINGTGQFQNIMRACAEDWIEWIEESSGKIVLMD